VTVSRIRRALAAPALAAVLSVSLAACHQGSLPYYAPPPPPTFSPCTPAQGHLVQDKSTGQLVCEP
jgi:hypothetical protein